MPINGFQLPSKNYEEITIDKEGNVIFREQTISLNNTKKVKLDEHVTQYSFVNKIEDILYCIYIYS